MVALARGLEILAFGCTEVDFLVVAGLVLVLVFVGADAASIGVKSLRGALLPVVCLVETIFPGDSGCKAEASKREAIGA